MISDITIAAETRTKNGSNEARRLRRAGRIPVTVYGSGNAALSVSVNGRQMAALLRSEEHRNSIFSLDVAGGDKTTVQLKEIQIHPVRGVLMHADLMCVDLAAKTRAKVPVHLIGTPQGVKLGGGVLDHGIREIEIECLPKDIPSHIDVQVESLLVGGHIYAGDLKLAEGLKLLSDGHQVVAAVLQPRGYHETETTEAAEPEVVKRGKTETEK